jgi:1,4-alpha-glucan branching enzyme
MDDRHDLSADMNLRQDWAQSDAYLGNVGLKATEPRGWMNLTAANKIRKMPRAGDAPHDRSQRYQLHVKSYFDANNDGVGDFTGLTQMLDYIKDLGTTAVWIMPFYPSPLRDDGYDISYYLGINPAYGGLRDFKPFRAGSA